MHREANVGGQDAQPASSLCAVEAWTHPLRSCVGGAVQVIDVGGGTGFCTQGIVKHVSTKNVTLLDQSDHQLAKAANKKDLQGVTIVQGDAEDLPFSADTFDRYVSAGSIEYWPEPQRGITVRPLAARSELCRSRLLHPRQRHARRVGGLRAPGLAEAAARRLCCAQEAYRVIKPGGVACLIGPVHPTWPISRFFADAWMLFPTEAEYRQWFEAAGFEDVAIKRIGPKWYRGVRRHGLIMGCSVTGVKRKVRRPRLDASRRERMSLRSRAAWPARHGRDAAVWSVLCGACRRASRRWRSGQRRRTSPRSLPTPSCSSSASSSAHSRASTSSSCRRTCGSRTRSGPARWAASE